MSEFNIYQDIAERTEGDIYIGIVGPVRTGKSTFIQQFMNKLVLPQIDDRFIKERTQDELPQSSGGKMIMTTEPKFVPEEAIKLTIKDKISFRVRMIDCVGYTVPGAVGYEDEDGSRMVNTPWYNHEIPFQEAAEVGTQKVINEHSTIGLVITTDGSFSELPRHNFVMAEERVINELKLIGKPFIIALNSTKPQNEETKEIAAKLSAKYEVPVIPIDCLHLQEEDIHQILKNILYEFPIKEFHIKFPGWLTIMGNNHWLKQSYNKTIQKATDNASKIRDVDQTISILADNENTRDVYLKEINPGEGLAIIEVGVLENLYFQIIEELSGFKVNSQQDLMSLVQDLSTAKKEYDRVEKALNDVKENGYGIVTPDLTDMSFNEPELIKRGNQFGVKLRASAPSIHMIRADINAEVSPVVGTEKQSVELITFFQEDFDRDPSSIWETEFLGRSLNEMVQNSISNKLSRMPSSA